MAQVARRDVFQAIADPTRRKIIHLISGQPLTLNAIADRFDVSRPAISQHIKILSECGLVLVKKKGRERFCQAKFSGLGEVSNWVDQYKLFWQHNFNSLEKYLNKVQTNKKAK